MVENGMLVGAKRYDPQRSSNERANDLTYACMELERRIRSLESEFEQTDLELKEKRYLNFALQDQIREFYRGELQNRRDELASIQARLETLGHPFYS